MSSRHSYLFSVRRMIILCCAGVLKCLMSSRLIQQADGIIVLFCFFIVDRRLTLVAGRCHNPVVRAVANQTHDGRPACMAGLYEVCGVLRQTEGVCVVVCAPPPLKQAGYKKDLARGRENCTATPWDNEILRDDLMCNNMNWQSRKRYETTACTRCFTAI